MGICKLKLIRIINYLKGLIRMLRRLQLTHFLRSFSTEFPSARSEYLLFPTSFPISPSYIYSAEINKHLYDYIEKHKIRYAAAFSVRPGVCRAAFHPLSLDDLENRLGLTGYTWSEKVSKPSHEISITDNNVIYDKDDRPLKQGESTPVRLVSSLEQLYPIGTVCNVNLHSEGQHYNIFLNAQIRFEAESIGPADSAWASLVRGSTIKAEPLTQYTKQYEELLEIYKRITAISRLNLPAIDAKESPIRVIELMSTYLCTLSYFSLDQLYQVFKTIAINQKIELLLRYYKQFLTVLEHDWKMLNEDYGNAQQRKNEAVNTIYENLKRIVGNPSQQKYIDKIRLKIKKRSYPPQILKLIEAELFALETEGSHDISRKKHFINLLTEYPFGILAKEEFDVANAKRILAEDHYGMEKVKRRILEFIAVSKLKGQFKSKVLLLYGPPGVGKTSIVKSIAKCLGRPYARISLGGEYDTSIIKGHRKTYLGAYPGKVWDAIYKSKVQNPVILLDEIDKIVNRAGGASLQDAVMQVLDPVQNQTFKDDFMDVQIDLSRVLFICTANSLSTIFPPLLDRLERIEVPGYSTIEKMEIFKRYILRQSMEENGLNEEMKSELDFTADAAKGLINGYCKEAGVRNLVRKTNKIFQKMALQYVKKMAFEKVIRAQNLKTYLGLPTFHDARLFEKAPPPGVMVGLAYNDYGGSIMYIECANQGRAASEAEGKDSKVVGQGSLLVTGNLHEVMKESCQLAYTYAKYILSTFFSNHYLETNDVHLNFPEIEIGKDGPSAGIAITSALISLALDKPQITEIAMTGEITLAGRVSPIGGVKEKTMGAKREGITHLIFPEDNRKDVQELQAQVREGMTFYFAEHYFQVMELVFGITIETQAQKAAA